VSLCNPTYRAYRDYLELVSLAKKWINPNHKVRDNIRREFFRPAPFSAYVIKAINLLRIFL